MAIARQAVFELFVRAPPPRRRFLFVAPWLHQAIDFLEQLRFSPADIEWLKSTRRFNNILLDHRIFDSASTSTRAVMPPTKGDGELITDFETERS